MATGVTAAELRYRFRGVPPNVLVLILDAARYDAFEPYGASKGATPVMADLASSGAALREVYSTACWTAPSHVSIFTGKMPRAAGFGRVPAPSTLQAGLEPLRDRALPEVLRRVGYETKALSANLWVSMGGFDHGFDEFEAVDSGRVGKLGASKVRDRIGWLVEAARARADDGARHAEEVFGRWVNQPQERPFFWFVNLVECHSPYLPPRPFGGFSPVSRLRAAEAARRYRRGNGPGEHARAVAPLLRRVHPLHGSLAGWPARPHGASRQA
jgi:arylsulfatase A-like enzyme